MNENARLSTKIDISDSRLTKNGQASAQLFVYTAKSEETAELNCQLFEISSQNTKKQGIIS